MINNNIIITGDAIKSMQKLPAASINTCVTSPPYFGLRDYGHDGQIGLEQTPDAFVQALVDVFREVRRVLRDDGTLWLNLGDSYARAGGWSNNNGLDGVATRQESSRPISNIPSTGSSQKLASGCKPKDLIGIPWRVAFALQADGWWLRQDIIWHKPNPMPESVRDRCTKAHEYIFMLTKSARYFYDYEAIKEPSVMKPQNRNTKRSDHPKGDAGRSLHVRPEGGTHYESRNRRSVWTVSTKPFKGAHFATFPPDLIKPCILAGCPEGGVVLDPFFGAGTTGLVAVDNNRCYIGIEINPEYVALAKKRLGTNNAAFAGIKSSNTIDPSLTTNPTP